MPDKQVILITGSSTGFGRLIAETLGRHGHNVFASMRDPAVRNATNASELRTLVGKESLQIHVVDMDVTDEGSVERAMHVCMEEAGRIDVVINNAGYLLTGLAEATTVDQARSIMDTNFLGCVRVNRAVLPFMRKQRSGLLIHVSSGAGRIVLPSNAFYCASTFAMEALAEAYHYELAQQGIESCIVEPGAYQTPVFANLVQAADHSRTVTYGAANQIGNKIASGLSAAAANPQEVADIILSIVEAPAGQRKLRYPVHPSDLGLGTINEVCAQVQQRTLQVFGIVGDTSFSQSSVAGAD